MAYIIPTPVKTSAQTELSSVHVTSRTATTGLLELDAALAQRVLARRRAAIVARPSVSVRLYTNPDGTVCTSRIEAQAFHSERFYTPAQ